MTAGSKTAGQVAEALGLEPHPEGGYFRETYRCQGTVETANGERSLATAILFMVTAGRPSRFHRLAADELWIHQAGVPLELLTIDAPGELVMHVLSALPDAEEAGLSGDAGAAAPGGGEGRARDDGAVLDVPASRVPQAVVPAGAWQAARLPRGGDDEDWALVACVVTPGFDYRDFELAERDALVATYPELRRTIVGLT